MLSALRQVRSTKLLLLLAAALSFGASFGLHPEPIVPREAGPPGDGTSWNAAAPLPRVAHGCPACLAHRSLSLAPLAGVALPRGPSLPVPAAARESRTGRVAFSQPEGRAPPAAS
jgi:hypothetical protein